MARCLGDTYGIVQLAWCDKVGQEKIIKAFSLTQYILSDNELKFDCKAVQDLDHRYNIQWKCTTTYNSQVNGVVERMVVTLEKALQKMTRSESK